MATKSIFEVYTEIRILDEGLRLKNISVGTTDHGRGAQIRPDLSGISTEASKKKANARNTSVFS